MKSSKQFKEQYDKPLPRNTQPETRNLTTAIVGG
jgi:hypothetical protein